jgi:PAS domain S-box-containing protein
MTEIELRSELRERRKAEDALRSKEQQLQAIVSNAQVIFYVIDKNGIIQMTEGKGLEKHNVLPNRLVGQSVFTVYADNHEVISAVRRALSGKRNSIMLEVPSPIGPLDYEISLSPLYDIENNITGAIGVLTDVTDLMAVEKTLENTIMRLTLLRRIESELSESLDLNSVLTIAMDAALRATGAEHGFIALIDGDQLRTVYTIGQFAPGVTVDSSEGIVGRAMRTLEPQLVLDVDADPDYVSNVSNIRAEMAIPLVHRDHLIGAMNLESSKPQLFTQEAFDFLTLVAGQITIAIDNAQLYQVSQQQLEELHQLYMRIMELEQLKTDMIRIAAHDLRNPLGVVTGFAQLLLEEPLNDEQLSFIKTIDNAGQKMQKIINDILSLQRIEASMDDKHCEEVDLVELVSEIFAGNRPRADEKAQTFTLDVPPPHVRLDVCVDKPQMREAIENLIGNAIKYTPDGGAVSVRVAAEGSSAVFEVEDTGFGIPEDQQGRLFQPFFRASNAKASQIEGTGLGLHLVKNIIERQGGRMRFHSTLGEGSLFGFSLPQR